MGPVSKGVDGARVVVSQQPYGSSSIEEKTITETHCGGAGGLMQAEDWERRCEMGHGDECVQMCHFHMSRISSVKRSRANGNFRDQVWTIILLLER